MPENRKYIAYPAMWPAVPAFHFGQFVERGQVEGMAIGRGVWFYYLRNVGWFRKIDLMENPEEAGIIAPGKFHNHPFTVLPHEARDENVDLFIDGDDLPTC